MRAQPFLWGSVVLSVLAVVFLVLEFLGRAGPLKGMFWVLLAASLAVGGVGDKLNRPQKGMRGLLPYLFILAGALIFVLLIVLLVMR